MSWAVLTAISAAVCGVFAFHELLASIRLDALLSRLDRLLQPLRRVRSEGSAPNKAERVRLQLLTVASAFSVGWLVAGPLLALALAVLGPWMVLVAVRSRRRRYREEFEAQLPLLIRALADLLSAGHSVRGSLVEVARALSGPAKHELTLVAELLSLGEATEIALHNLRSRVVSAQLDNLVAALILQRDAGGNLVALLRGMAASLEDAHRLQADARSATAQARLTALMVAAMPLIAALLIELASSGSLAKLVGNPISAWLTLCAVLFQAGGMFAVRQIAKVS